MQKLNVFTLLAELAKAGYYPSLQNFEGVFKRFVQRYPSLDLTEVFHGRQHFIDSLTLYESLTHSGHIVGYPYISEDGMSDGVEPLISDLAAQALERILDSISPNKEA